MVGYRELSVPQLVGRRVVEPGRYRSAERKRHPWLSLRVEHPTWNRGFGNTCHHGDRAIDYRKLLFRQQWHRRERERGLDLVDFLAGTHRDWLLVRAEWRMGEYTTARWERRHQDTKQLFRGAYRQTGRRHGLRGS